VLWDTQCHPVLSAGFSAVRISSNSGNFSPPQKKIQVMTKTLPHS